MGASPILTPGALTASLVEDMQCAGAVGTVAWGVLLSLPRKPGEGMHLLPNGAQFLSWALIQHGEQPDLGPVTLSHTVGGTFRTWKILHPDDAIRVGNAIGVIVQGMGG